MLVGTRGLRNVSRRLVIELALVVLLAGFPVDFPRHTSAGKAWSFVFAHPSVLLHVVIGALALTEAVVFVVRATPTRRPRLLIVAGLGLVSTLVAFGSGIGYVGGGQGDLALTLMTVGWVAAMVTYVVGWVLGRRSMRAERPNVAVG
jgi:hypothetical protein